MLLAETSQEEVKLVFGAEQEHKNHQKNFVVLEDILISWIYLGEGFLNQRLLFFMPLIRYLLYLHHALRVVVIRRTYNTHFIQYRVRSLVILAHH